jgi:hypothetical protein
MTATTGGTATKAAVMAVVAVATAGGKAAAVRA